MADAKDAAVTSALESQETSSSYYHKSADTSDQETQNNNESRAASGVAGSPFEMGNIEDESPEQLGEVIEAIEAKKKVWYAYLTTWDFWIVVILGQVLALCNTGTSTFSTLLVDQGTSIPAFQSLFNYVLLVLLYSTYTVYRYGLKRYFRLFYVDGWKYFILSFMDVEGNYFTVLAYRYTTILSAQLINFWSIVCVVIVSFTLLKVRYKWPQVLGILICCAGQGILLTSDHIQGTNGGSVPNQLKGDLFCLLGATFYGLSNVFEEWFVSKRPMYEVLGMLGFFGVLINGVQAAIFDRDSFRTATWNGKVGGYLVGYTLILNIFYGLAPLILRLASAAFFDISLLTGNFWGVAIGISVFGYSIYFLYPIAFVLIIIGLVIYFISNTVLADSKKPWLGPGQENGVVGVGTAKWKAKREARRAGQREEVSGGDHIA